MIRELKVVNCTIETRKKRGKALWSAIDKAFAKPINPTDDVADYVPTQVLSELFKSKGFDGIAYRSSLGDGYNIALFDIHSAKIINCFLYTLKGIKFDFSEMANSYYLTKHNKKRIRKSS